MLVKKLVMALCLCAGLSGCQMTLPEFGAGRDQASVHLASSNFIVSALDGFCVDSASIKDTAQAGFVLMADCAALRGKKHKVKQTRSVLLTTAVSAPLENAGSVTASALEKFFETPQGRTTLSRKGEADTVFASMEIVRGDILVLHIRDSSPANINGLMQDDWRAFIVIKDRLVTLTAASFVGAHAANPSAETLVIQLARGLQAENSAD